MQLGMIGVGRMGGSMALRLIVRDVYRCLQISLAPLYRDMVYFKC
jgi:6-phosphogluconate dehydrogenase (decarboxylating)